MNRMQGWAVGAALAAMALIALTAGKPDDHSMAPLPPVTPGLASATFAMGCFWSAESAFEGLPGVRAVTSGYTGGQMDNPDYEQVCSGQTGHMEAVQVLYDPKKIGYPQLLDVFWHNVDPTSADGQFTDYGPQYRPAIFVHDDAQRKMAEASKQRLQSAPQRFKGPIVVPVLAESKFWPAERYHQDYFRKSSIAYQAFRLGSGHDARLVQLWGKPGRSGH